jgi:hypothetical protein
MVKMNVLALPTPMEDGRGCHGLTLPGTFLEGAAYHPVTVIQAGPHDEQHAGR